ncbi:MAG: hypothetical protein ACRDD4_01695 [Culicoidibacterales bacterium]
MALVKSIDFYGKHAEIVNLLTESNVADKKSIPIFERKLDVWYIAGFLGLKHNRCVTEVSKSNDLKTSVFAETVTNNSDEINLYTTLVALKLADLNNKKQLQAALLNELETNGEKISYELARMDLFHQYALGGLEYISEKLLTSGINAIDDVDFNLITSQFVAECAKKDNDNVFDDLF